MVRDSNTVHILYFSHNELDSMYMCDCMSVYTHMEKHFMLHLKHDNTCTSS